jgi:hypothetical protein
MPATQGQCKFCNNISTLVESHVIPKGLYWELVKENGKPSIEMSPHDGEYPARRPGGYYDYFLCSEHEKQFNDWDTYACELLRSGIPARTNGGWIFQDINYSSIKLFFLSLLWRAHSAKIKFFDRIDLGPHANRIRNLIENKDASTPDNYSVSLWRSEELQSKAIIAPLTERYDGVTFVKFYLPGYMALIKVDKRPLKNEFKINVLGNSSSWYVLEKKYENSSEEAMMLKVYKQNRRK